MNWVNVKVAMSKWQFHMSAFYTSEHKIIGVSFSLLRPL